MTTSEPVDCRVCQGRGTTTDTRAASITHRIGTRTRRCRTCHGEGKITPTIPALPEQTEIGEIPDWMLG
jgi:DnaJ-class molecular chaperone